MEFFVAVYNALMDHQIELAVGIVLLIWLVVRGGDLFRWLWRRIRPSSSLEDDSQENSDSPKNA